MLARVVWLLALLLAACSGTPTTTTTTRTTTTPGTEPAPADNPTAAPKSMAERALEEHELALESQLGVVRARAEGDTIVLELCDILFTPFIDVSGVDLPVEMTTSEAKVNEAGEPCGCYYSGATYRHGQPMRTSSCQVCECDHGGPGSCKSTCP